MKSRSSAGDHQPAHGDQASWLADVELKAGLLRGVPLFSGLSDDDLRAIGSDLSVMAYRAGDVVMSPDDSDERLYIVKGGRVRLYRVGNDGKQLTLDVLDRGSAIGRMGWMGPGLRSVYAEAIEDSLICSYTPAELERLIERYPVVGLNLIRYLSDRLAAAERQIELTAYGTVEQRLAARLIALADRFGNEADAGETVIGARLTQQELADMIGTTRETLAQAIARLRSDGVVEMANQRVVIRDRAALESRARD